MSSILYAKDHEYVIVDGDTATVGISVYAQEQLGDVVFVELPDVGKALSKGDEAAVVESVKAASEVYTPLDGEVTEVNKDLEGTPATVNEDPLGRGWFFRMTIADKSQLDELMDEDAYKAFCEGL